MQYKIQLHNIVPLAVPSNVLYCSDMVRRSCPFFTSTINIALPTFSDTRISATLKPRVTSVSKVERKSAVKSL